MGQALLPGEVRNLFGQAEVEVVLAAVQEVGLEQLGHVLGLDRAEGSPIMRGPPTS